MKVMSSITFNSNKAISYYKQNIKLIKIDKIHKSEAREIK